MDLSRYGCGGVKGGGGRRKEGEKMITEIVTNFIASHLNGNQLQQRILVPIVKKLACPYIYAIS